jgi:hypothetical protein
MVYDSFNGFGLNGRIGLGMSYLSDQKDVVIRWFRFIWYWPMAWNYVFKGLCISSS